jgi:hypothetical protein
MTQSVSRTVRKNLLAIVAEYRRATGASLSEVSKRFYGNATFLEEFKNGNHSISIGKLDTVVTKFRNDWPEDADWPYLSPIFMDR